MQPNTPPNEPKKKSTTRQNIIAITALILFGSGYCFAQSKETGQIMKTNIKQDERIAALEKRIAETSDDFVSLTVEEYDLMLSKPIGMVDGFKPLTTTAGGIMVGIDMGLQPVIQTIFPKIPNIGEGEVFVIFDFVKDTNGLDFLNRKKRGFGRAIDGIDEIEEDESTQLTLDTRTAGSKSYLFGSRDVRLLGVKTGESTSTIRSFRDAGTASGKVVINLPTNITGLALTKKGDIGVEKSFAGGVITLKKADKAGISFQFSGDTKRIYTWTVYDVDGNILGEKGVSLENGLYQIAAKNPQSVKVYQAEIVRKEYPFAFAVVQKKATPPPLFEGIDAARISAAMFFQTQLLQTKNAAPVYLDKNDPIAKSIKGRAITDLRQSTRYMDPESPESKLIQTRMKAWSEEKKNQLQALGLPSIQDYTTQTLFDAGTFMLVFSSFKEMEQKKIPEGWDIRVQHLGGDKYIAEFWEDSHAAHPEAKNDIGKNTRYYKMMALFYTLEKGGSVTFHNPFQPTIDFLKK